MHKTLLFTVAAFALCPSAPATAGPRDFAVYATRLGGDPDAAQPYLAKFMAYLETEAGWPKGSAKAAFLTSRKEATAFIDSTNPGLGFIEPALYLELRKSHGLELLAQIDSRDLNYDRLNVVVKDPALKSIGDLKGKRLATLLDDSTRFLSKVVLDGQADADKFFQLKHVGQPMKGARALLRGDVDATLLDTQQLEAAKKLDGGDALRAVFSSRPLPPLPVVAFSKAVRPEERKRVTKVLLEMCASPKGADICKEMLITKIVPVNAALFQDAQKRYEAP